MTDISILTLPAAISGLSDAEVHALQNVEGLAEDLAMRGDQRAGNVLEWVRDMLAIEKKLSETDTRGTER